MDLNLRALEKGNKFGFLFYISYNGDKFHSFDEVSGKNSVKSTFIKIITELGFSWAKGVQQGGRTDSKVSASENILYVSSKYSGDLGKLSERFNQQSPFLKIKKIIKTLPNLVLPDLVESREYIYTYPLKKISNSLEEIEKLSLKFSGKYDVSQFTDRKGLELKEHIREVQVSFNGKDLYFVGNSFMPKQVRVMSSYILTNSYEPLPGKYLTLNKINLKKELEDMFINNNNLDFKLFNSFDFLKNIDISQVKSEIIGTHTTILYIPKKIKGEFIGKNGCNIKKLKKLFNNIIVREV